MLGVSHIEVCISARFAGGGVRFHTVVLSIQYIIRIQHRTRGNDFW